MDPIRFLVGLAAGRIPRLNSRTPAYLGLSYQDVIFPSAHSDRVPLSGWLLSPQRPRGVVTLPRRVSEELYAAAGQPKALWNAPFTPHVMAAVFAPRAFGSRLADFLARFEGPKEAVPPKESSNSGLRSGAAGGDGKTA